MKNLINILVFVSSLSFANTNYSELNEQSREQIKNQMRDKIINKNDDWQKNPYSSEWAKRITHPENCRGKGAWDTKIHDVMTISTNVMGERPDVWLNGKYLEFVNSQCSLSGVYSIRGSTKKSFEQVVDRYFYEKENGRDIGFATYAFIIFFSFIFWTMTKYKPMRFIY
ncbi:hypothetical protein [Aliarcobacter lanthieri]|uniref:hypothetical protein n=1 Tax=Aliarcobacter lanthieri TaxID=1355374 RepID=UPI00047EF4AD|nr:hypothetical protein [Aliarcobacter lanthieri]QKF59206.1 hypothetical protein ALANTH_1097 [Aliarcobacter lanthieri]